MLRPEGATRDGPCPHGTGGEARNELFTLEFGHDHKQYPFLLLSTSQAIEK
jgi:hypothetical protein